MRYQTCQVTFSPIGGSAAAPLPYTIQIPPTAGQPAGASSTLQIPAAEGPTAVRISFILNEGSLAIALVSEKSDRFISPPRVFHASPGTQDAFFLLDTPERARFAVFGVSTNQPARVELLEAAYTQDDGTLANAALRLFPHWYYTVDLSHDTGIVKATVSDEATWTKSCRMAELVYGYLLEHYVGDVRGRTLLDAACNAGHWSFFFARRGARVHGFDLDAGAVSQAKFVGHLLRAQFAEQPEFSQSSLEQFRAHRPYDIVFCSGLFYHLTDPLGGAKKLYDLTKRWLILQSCVSDRDDEVFELSDHNRWPFCADYEFCLVPSAAMVESVFAKTGLRTVASFRLSDFDVDLEDQRVTVSRTTHAGTPNGSPIYLVLEKPQ